MAHTTARRPQLATSGPTEVGRFYLVPCMWADRTKVGTGWIPPSGWVPVLGPRHEDAEHLDFPHTHYHIDWRFVPERQFQWACGPQGIPHNQVLTNTHGTRDHLEGRPELRRLKCRRPMPAFPVVAELIHANTRAKAWIALEEAHRCTRLKPGNVCPHRGIDLTPFAQADGTAICPGHGLRWNLKTGELMPYQNAPRSHYEPTRN